MQPRAINYTGGGPPLKTATRAPEMMQHHFARKKQPDNGGAHNFAYDTGGFQKMTRAGGGTFFRTAAPLGYGQKPVVVLPVLVAAKEPIRSGAIPYTPLSASPKK